VFSIIGIEPESKGNDILDEMMSAAKDSVSNIEESSVRDAALIANGNEVEHYEIALYGTLAAFARSLGFQDAADLLKATLNEEKNADAKLTQIGETLMNAQAARHQTA
jgi:ferritin-like metal-binding protein YciE